ncbi:MAG TPA: hypothetical protein VJK53_00215 [Candidatus Paceibacterota bacterium]
MTLQKLHFKVEFSPQGNQMSLKTTLNAINIVIVVVAILVAIAFGATVIAYFN